MGQKEEFASSIEGMNAQMAILTDQRNQLAKDAEANKATLDEIAAKSEALTITMGILDSREAAIATRETDSAALILKGESVLAIRVADMDQRENILAKKEQNATALLEANVNNEAALAAREETIKIKEAELAQKLADAQPILDQAAAVVKDKADVAFQKANFKVQLDQLQFDINQVKTNQVALANKTAELQQRESIVRQAEQKIAGGAS